MQRERGFTLVELVVVLMVSAVLGIVVLPRLTGPGEFAARGARDQVQTTLRYARQAAIAMRRNVCVSLGTTQLVVTHASAQGVGAACVGSNVVVHPANGLPFGDAANALPAGAGLATGGALVFNAEGRPYASVGNALTTAASFAVQGYPDAVTVEPETGVVR